MAVRIKRAYEDASPKDGRRVLVDRLWPRGRSKEALNLDDWARDLGPSTQLRKWFGHEPDRWQEFSKRYREELRDPRSEEELEKLATAAERGTVTLVYGAKDTEHNEAVVLQDVIQRLSAANG